MILVALYAFLLGMVAGALVVAGLILRIGIEFVGLVKRHLAESKIPKKDEAVPGVGGPTQGGKLVVGERVVLPPTPGVVHRRGAH